ncbi:MAG: hypothetical protein ACT4OX_15895 [Actinomycetota bacterium]
MATNVGADLLEELGRDLDQVSHEAFVEDPLLFCARQLLELSRGPDFRWHEQIVPSGCDTSRSLSAQDIRVVLRHDTIAATQSYLADNPLRILRQMHAFTIEL